MPQVKIKDRARLELVLSADEKQIIEETAEAVGVNASEYVRLMCLPERRHRAEKVNAAIKRLCARRAAS